MRQTRNRRPSVRGAWGRVLAGAWMLGAWTCAAPGQGTVVSEGRYSSIVSDGTLGAGANTEVTAEFLFEAPVRGVRLSGSVLRTSDLSSLGEARVRITSPSGASIDVAPVSLAGAAGARYDFFDITYDWPVPEPTGTGQWTARFYESADQGGEDALWESFTLALSASPPMQGPPPNDSFLNAQPIGEGTTSITTIGAASEGLPVECSTGVRPHNDVWFRYTATQDGHVALSMCGGAGFDAAVVVFTDTLIAVECDDDGCGAVAGAPALSFEATAGQSYLIQVGGAVAGAEGTGLLALQGGAGGLPACVHAPGGGFMSGHSWPTYFFNDCRYICKCHKIESLGGVGTTSFTRAYRSQFAFDRDCLVQETVTDRTRYDVIFWISAGAGQPWAVRVDTRRQGWFTIDNDGVNASTITMTPVSGWVTSFVPVGNSYVPGNAVIFSGSLGTGTSYGWSEGNSNCADTPFLDTGTAVVTGVGSQSVHLNFAWDATISSGDRAGIRMGDAWVGWTPSGTFMQSLQGVGGYGGCNNRNPANDGHFVTVTCLNSNDLCSGCTPAGLGTTTSSNFGATTDSASTCANGERDVFFCFKSVCGGPTTVSTCGSNFDTVLSIHSGCPSGTGNELACNDDAFTGPCAGGPTSLATFNAAPCATYYIRVAGFAGEQGNIVLNISQPTPAAPPNDLCANATPVGNGVFSYSTCGATTDGTGCPAQRDVWFKYRPTCYGTVKVGPCGMPCMTNPSTKALFQVYEGVCGTLTEVPPGTLGCYIINNATGCPDSARTYTFQASPCKDYYIRIGTSGSGGGFMSGQMSVTASAPSNDTCAGATVIGTGTVQGGTTCATLDGSAACGASATTRDVWYSYTPSCAGQVTVHTCFPPGCGAFYDSVVSVHTGCPGTTGNQIACNDDDPWFCGTFALSSRVTFTAQACTRYLIRVSGFAGSSGNFSLTVSQTATAPANDLCANATTIGANSSAAFSTCQANTDGPAGPAVFNDVWYKFVACSSGPFTASTCLSPAGQNTSLAVYAGACGSLALVTANDNNGPSCAGNLASASFSTVVGQTYFIRVGSPVNGAGVCGTLSLSGNNPATAQCPPGGATSTTMYTIIGNANGLPFTYRLSRACCFDLCRTHPGVSAGQPASVIASSWAAHINAQCGTNLSATTSGANIIVKTKGCAAGSLQLAVGAGGAGCGALCVVAGTNLPTSGPCAFNPEIVEVPLSGRDCNGNGEDDTIDIFTGASQDLDGDGIPDECGRLAGDVDDFQTSGEPTDGLTIRPPLAAFLGRPGGHNAVLHGGAPLPFDVHDPDRWEFGYTFTGLPRMLGARLRLHVGAGTLNTGQEDDGVSLQFVGPGSTFAWSASFALLDGLAGGDGAWSAGEDGAFMLDLASLPREGLPPLDLISQLNQDRYLDVYIQDGTAVDYAQLFIDAAPACACDWNGSGTLSVQDIFDFLASFFAGAGDFNLSGDTTVQDIFDFLACYFGGCV